MGQGGVQCGRSRAGGRASAGRALVRLEGKRRLCTRSINTVRTAFSGSTAHGPAPARPFQGTEFRFSHAVSIAPSRIAICLLSFLSVAVLQRCSCPLCAVLRARLSLCAASRLLLETGQVITTSTLTANHEAWGAPSRSSRCVESIICIHRRVEQTPVNRASPSLSCAAFSSCAYLQAR